MAGDDDRAAAAAAAAAGGDGARTPEEVEAERRREKNRKKKARQKKNKAAAKAERQEERKDDEERVVLSPAQKQCLDIIRAGLRTMLEEVDEPLPLDEALGAEDRRQKLMVYAQVLTKEVSRFVLYASNSTEAGAIVPVSERLVQNVEALVCLLRSLSSGGSGSTLARAASTAGAGILRSLVSVMDDFEARLSRGEKPQLAHTGKALDGIEKLQRLPVTDAEAVGRALVPLTGTLKDAREELKETEVREEGDEGDEGAAGGLGGGGGDDEDFFDDFGASEALSPAEYRMVAPCEELIKVAYACAKRVCAAALREKDASDVARAADLEALLASARRASAGVDELVGAVQGPQERDAVATASAAVAFELGSMLDRLAAASEDEAAWAASVRAHLDKALAAVDAARREVDAAAAAS